LVCIANSCGRLADGGDLDGGSDLLWTSRFEGNSFDEWTSVPGGSAGWVAPNTMEVSNELERRRRFVPGTGDSLRR
jgi:hypothetical protein